MNDECNDHCEDSHFTTSLGLCFHGAVRIASCLSSWSLGQCLCLECEKDLYSTHMDSSWNARNSCYLSIDAVAHCLGKCVDRVHVPVSLCFVSAALMLSTFRMEWRGIEVWSRGIVVAGYAAVDFDSYGAVAEVDSSHH